MVIFPDRQTLYDYRSSRLRNFAITELRDYGTSRLRNFTITELHDYGTSRLRNFTITELHDYGTSRLRNFMSAEFLNVEIKRQMLKRDSNSLFEVLLTSVDANHFETLPAQSMNDYYSYTVTCSAI